MAWYKVKIYSRDLDGEFEQMVFADRAEKIIDKIQQREELEELISKGFDILKIELIEEIKDGENS